MGCRQRFQKFPPMHPNFPLSPLPMALPSDWWRSSCWLLVGLEQEQFWGHLCHQAYQKVVTAEYIHLTPWDSVVPPHHGIQVFLGVLFQQTFPVEDQWTSLLRWHHGIRRHRLIAGQGFLPRRNGPWLTMNYHGHTTMDDHVSLNGTPWSLTVVDHGHWPWSLTMVTDHGHWPWCHLTKHGRPWSRRPWSLMVDHGSSRSTMVIDGRPW